MLKEEVLYLDADAEQYKIVSNNVSFIVQITRPLFRNK